MSEVAFRLLMSLCKWDSLIEKDWANQKDYFVKASATTKSDAVTPTKSQSTYVSKSKVIPKGNVGFIVPREIQDCSFSPLTQLLIPVVVRVRVLTGYW